MNTSLRFFFIVSLLSLGSVQGMQLGKLSTKQKVVIGSLCIYNAIGLKVIYHDHKALESQKSFGSLQRSLGKLITVHNQVKTNLSGATIDPVLAETIDSSFNQAYKEIFPLMEKEMEETKRHRRWTWATNAMFWWSGIDESELEKTTAQTKKNLLGDKQ